MSDPLAPLIRRAILDFLEAEGGEHNDDVLAMRLGQRGQRFARRDVAAALDWLGTEGLANVETLGPYRVARIVTAGIDVAQGLVRVEGVYRHKTGE